MRNKKIKEISAIKAWAVLDVDGKIKHPSVSLFDTKKEAQKEAKALNKLPSPTDKKYPYGGKNIIVPVEIKLLSPNKK